MRLNAVIRPALRQHPEDTRKMGSDGPPTARYGKAHFGRQDNASYRRTVKLGVIARVPWEKSPLHGFGVHGGRLIAC
jgi:hypothetical protein